MSGISLGRTGGKNVPGAAQFNFFEPVDDLVKIEYEMCAIGDEHAITAVQTFFIQGPLGEKKNGHDVNIRAFRFQGIQLCKKRRQVHNNARPNHTCTRWIYQPYSNENMSDPSQVILGSNTRRWEVNGMQKSS
jgi:hypothetical protein